MDFWNVMAGGAALGLLASCWGKLKEIAWRITSFAVQRVELQSEAAHTAVISHLIKHYKRSRTYDRVYGANYEHFRAGRYGLVPFEQFGVRNLIFWNGWWPMIYSNLVEARASRASGNDSPSSGDATKVYAAITFLRGTVDVERILAESCQAQNNLSWLIETNEEQAKNRFVIHHVPRRSDRDSDDHGYGYGSNGLAWYQQGNCRLLGLHPDELGKAPLCRGRALDALIFPERIKELITEIELWRGNREWYLDKGIPWKRGWLLYGPPGTGKTALARAFAQDLNMPIYVYNLAQMSNFDLIRAWAEMQVNVPCIALIEDIDNVFHGRENVSRKNLGGMLVPHRHGPDDADDNAAHRNSAAMFTPLTFDCLLNCLDGVERADGIFTIITTNDLSKIDPALGQPRRRPDGTCEFISTRPGRIDKAVELTFMELADKKRMAKRILGEYPDEYLTMLEFIDQFPDLEETPAQFQERCGQIALKCFWRERHGRTPEPPPTSGGRSRPPVWATSEAW